MSKEFHQRRFLYSLVMILCTNALWGQELTDSAFQSELNRFCVDCHSKEVQEGQVQLDQWADMDASVQVTFLSKIDEQLYLRQMPPADEIQPTDSELRTLEALVQQQFEQLGATSTFRAKLRSPSYGNYLNHDQLFSGEVTELPYSPSRLWRTSPHAFEQIKTDWGGNANELRQPFIVDDKQGIREYASLLFADSAVVDVLLNNAGTVADQLIEKDSQFREIAAKSDSPVLDQLGAAIEKQFLRVVYRKPTPAESDRYTELFQQSLEQSDPAEALRVVLMAIMLHPESVYRVEIGLGPQDEYGRHWLAPTELAFAIAYALTDQRPDAVLMQAVREGRLSSREDVQREVERILNDPEIAKPRILRFFQEFFGYTNAHKVFKDAKRSGGFSYYGENYPVMYERDADFFVLNILERDQDVFRELLTSDKYFILNRQTFRNTVYDFYRKNQEMLDADEFPPEKDAELLGRLGLRGWHELNEKYYLHKFNRGFKGNPKAIKQIVKEARNWKNTTDEQKLLHGMQPLYNKYPMVYDLKDDEQDFLLPQPYQRPHRAGMLTHPAWLIAHSLNDSTDPIRRGKWIQERLLAGTVPDLPITVDATIPEDHSRTLRERLDVTEQEACWRCHRQMNPLGYPFEVYDDFGRYRERESLDKLPKVDGEFPWKPVNASSVLVGTGEAGLDGSIDDALDLIDRLAASDRVRQSMIRHTFRYFMGRNEMVSDSQTLIAADQAYLESGGSYNALLVSLLTSDSFLFRK